MNFLNGQKMNCNDTFLTPYIKKISKLKKDNPVIKICQNMGKFVAQSF